MRAELQSNTPSLLADREEAATAANDRAAEEAAAAAVADAEALVEAESKSPKIQVSNLSSANFSAKSSPGQRARMTALKTKDDVFPAYFIRKLKKEFADAKKQDDEMEDDEYPFAVTDSGYHRGITAMLLEWWKQRNSVNEQVRV